MQAGENQGRWYYNCFVSSTSVDLKERYRPAARRAIETLRQHPVMMEDFGAFDGDAQNVSTTQVATADIFLLVVAWRYGYVPRNETRSVTHLEYLEAKRLGKPRLVFLAAADTEARDDLFPRDQRDEEYTAALHAFRAEVEQDRVAAYFTTPDELERAVVRALNEYLREHPPGRRNPRDVPPLARGFVGREHEVESLLATLRSEQSMAISAAVQGMPGVGKSTLAAEVVRKLVEDQQAFPGGIAYVFCGEQQGDSGLLWVYDRLLAAWDASLTPNQLAAAQTPDQALALRERALRERLRPLEGVATAPALVLLDNVEEGLPLAAALALLGALNVTALVTARHRPSVPGLRLLPLDVLDPPAALALFAERYQEAGGDWREARDQEPAAWVVETLGWLPLAIELSAADAALEGQGVAALAARVADDARRLDSLTDPTDTTRSVRYAFTQSYARLAPPLQEAFAALGLPSGTDWPREVIEHMLAGALGDMPDALTSTAALNALAARAMVTLAVEPGLGGASPAPRVRLHPLLRAYAGERYAALSEERKSTVLAALMAAVLDFTKAHRERTAAAFAVLGAEEALIADALRSATSAHVALEAALATVWAFQDYCYQGGHWTLGRELLALAQEVCRQLGDRAGEGATLNNLGALARRQGQTAEAAAYYQQALALARAVGDRAGEGATLNNLGLLADRQGQTAEAAAYYQQALALRRAVGDRAGEGATLNNLGALADRQGQTAEAAAYYQQALALRRAVGDRAGEATTLHNIAFAAETQGRYDEAEQAYRASLAIFTELGLESDVHREREALARLASRDDVALAASSPQAESQDAEGEAETPPMEAPVPAKPDEKVGWWSRMFGRRQR